MTTKYRTEVKTVTLSDGRKVTQLTGINTRRILGFIPYTRKTICFVARESDVIEVAKSFREHGIFFPNDKAWPQHRAIHVANRKFITRTCNCSVSGFVTIPDSHMQQDVEAALAQSLTAQVRHIDDEKTPLSVVS